MRKRRVILYDDDPAILEMLTLFFQELGYEVIAYSEPVDCAVYNENERCIVERPCADIVITDFEMPRMTGLELLERQVRRGCHLDSRNKAVFSGNLDPARTEAIRKLGCAVFHKPCRMSTLAAWALECEQRMDLTQPLGVKRREQREECRFSANFNVEDQDDPYVGEVVNRSRVGLCVQASKPLAVAQVLSLRPPVPLASIRFEVRWTRPDGGGCFAGMLSC